MTKFLGFLQPKNGVLRDKKKNEAINTIREHLESIPNYKDYKDDMEILLYVCMMVEHLIDNKKKKKYMIDKKEIVLNVYERVFGKIDKEIISKNIEFLHENGKIIKVSCLTILLKTIQDWIIRKIA